MRKLCAALKSIPVYISVIFVLFVTSAHAQVTNTTGYEPLGELEVSDHTLAFGGSFSPPTLDHGGTLAYIAYRFGFKNALMMPTLPYKKGAAPAWVSESLTRLAVEHFDEVLENSSIEFREFKSLSSGVAQWVGKAGREFKISVDNYDIREKNPENTLKTLTHLKEQAGGDPRKVFWLAGGDSFASVPSWTPEWRKLFDQAHWLVVARPGFDQGPKDINFYRTNPLKNIYDEEFLNQFEYEFDKENQVHIYKNHDETKPNIYVIRIPSAGDSSSANRKSLAEEQDHDHAQVGLQPSVFKECVKQNYYGKETEVQGYKLLTPKNMEAYLRWQFSRIEQTAKEKLDPEASQDLREMTDTLVEVAKQSVKESKNKPAVIAAIINIYEGVKEWISEYKNLKLVRNKLRDAQKKYGIKTFAKIFVGLEIAEKIIVPPLAYYLGGKTGLLLSPLIHQEYISIPSFIIWNVAKEIGRRKLLAGDKETYRELTDYRNKLMRGDPSTIIAREELTRELGLDGSPLVINIVKSRLPKWVPLSIRQWDDKRVTWHDLNVSTNELQAILSDDALSKELLAQANEDYQVFAHLLLSAVLSKPETAMRLELFTMHRYFKRLFMGNIPDELMGGYSPQERSVIEFLRARSADYKSLNPTELNELGEILSHFYSISRLVQLNPELASSQLMWETAVDLMVTKYPGRKINLKNKKQIEFVRARMKILRELLVKAYPTLFSNATIPYLDSNFKLDSKLETILISALHYVSDEDAIERAFSARHAGGYKTHAEILPIRSRGNDLEGGNLVWEIHKLKTIVKRQVDLLQGNFDRLYERLIHDPGRLPKIEKTYQEAFEKHEKEVSRLLEKFKDLEYAWLKEKYKYRVGPAAKDETLIPTYAEYAAKYKELHQLIEKELKAIQGVNHTTAGLHTCENELLVP